MIVIVVLSVVFASVLAVNILEIPNPGPTPKQRNTPPQEEKKLALTSGASAGFWLSQGLRAWDVRIPWTLENPKPPEP